MKICLITKECFPFSYGGIGSAFYFFGKALSEWNHEVVLFTRKPLNYDSKIYDAHYNEKLRTEWVNYREGAFSAHAVLDYSYQLAEHFEHISTSYKTDIVIYPEFDGDAYFLVRAKYEKQKYKDTAFAVHYSGPLASLYEAEKRVPSSYEKIIFELEEFCIRESAISISPSAFIWDTLNKKFGLEQQSTIIFPNPVNPVFLSRSLLPPEKRPVNQKNILFVGRLQKTKGVDQLMDAFQTIIAKGTEDEVRLQLIGKDVYWEDYQMNFTDYWKGRLSPEALSKLDFIGPLSQTEIKTYLQDAWIAVFPSRFEVFGNVALEALYCGTPVLVNKKTGLSGVIGAGYSLSWDGDPGTLAAQLLMIIQDVDLRNRLVKQSVERAEELHAKLPAAIPGLLEQIITVNGTKGRIAARGIEEKLFPLLNQYSTERLQEKNNEIRFAYNLKDEELRKAWMAYDKKDEEILSIWDKYNEKDRELADLWKKHDEQISELNQARLLSTTVAEKENISRNLTRNLEKTISALASLQETNNELQKVNQDQEKRIQLLWNDLQHQHEELKNHQTAFDQTKNALEKKETEIRDLYIKSEEGQEELKNIKESRSYRLSQSLERRKWASKILGVFFKK